jgi:hypothetical protein
MNIIVHITFDSLSFRRGVILSGSSSTFRILKTPDSTSPPPGSSDESIVDVNSNDLTRAPELSWYLN